MVWVSFPDHPLVCRLPNHHHFPVLAMPHSIPKQKSFVLLSYSLWHSQPDKGWVFSLTNFYGMHLVTLALFPSFGWHVIIIGHFPLKKLKREPQNILPPSPHRQTTSSLTSDLWLTAPVLAGYKWVVPESCACCTSI